MQMVAFFPETDYTWTSEKYNSSYYYVTYMRSGYLFADRVSVVGVAFTCDPLSFTDPGLMPPLLQPHETPFDPQPIRRVLVPDVGSLVSNLSALEMKGGSEGEVLVIDLLVGRWYASIPVLPFSKSNKILIGYFDPVFFKR